MAMTLEEAKKKLNQDLAKKRKGYLAENAYRQSPEGIKKGKENLVSMLEYTPAAIPIEGYRAYDNIKKGNYLDAAIDAGVGIGMGVAPLAVKPIAKLGGKAYKSLKNIFSGPLSPQYNSEGMNPKKMIKEQAREMLKKILAPLSEKPTKAQKEKMEDMLEAKLELQRDYPDSDITFQHSMNPDRDINNFRSRPVNVSNKAAFGKGPGLFGHGLTDASKFEQFGPNVYAIVHPRNKPTFSGKMDTESNLNESFIRTPDIEDLVKVKLRGQK